MSIDDFILSSVSQRWTKVALIVGRALSSSELESPDGDFEPQSVADRIQALVQAGDLEAAGNLNDWRHCEVRISQ